MRRRVADAIRCRFDQQITESASRRACAALRVFVSDAIGLIKPDLPNDTELKMYVAGPARASARFRQL